MNWSKLTKEEKNALIAEHVWNWQRISEDDRNLFLNEEGEPATLPDFLGDWGMIRFAMNCLPNLFSAYGKWIRKTETVTWNCIEPVGKKSTIQTGSGHSLEEAFWLAAIRQSGYQIED